MIETLKFYISQLLPKRAKIYSKSWWTVGYIIYKQTKGSVEGCNLWHEFSAQDIDDYTNNVCDKKWESFKKACYPIPFRTLTFYVNEDGGTIYNPDHNHFVEDSEVRNFVYLIIIPKLSIRRMRNRIALNNLCSAMFHMSSGKDRDAMLKVCKRITDKQLKETFITSWDFKSFIHCNTMNDIICWYNSDEKEKPYPRGTNINAYTLDDPLWLEQTTNYLKSFDSAGYTPKYFKVSAEERENLKLAIAKRSHAKLLVSMFKKKKDVYNKRDMLVNDNFKFATKCEFKSKTWFDIGKLIYKLSEGSEEGYRLWVMYSKMDQENFDDYYCYEYWNFLDSFAYSDFESDESIRSEESNESDLLPEGW